ncbi:hypothetical protein [Demequina mangrovi]|uniref:Uncharacterized protein n=1 Tax=Demequina mangrovi TaxID=1043493 RepID=A0A1H7A8C1_9MICO|nr:hypothetical protein [Demequina mangrovi]SEJ57285.1 hypothetical protein SAMN05421637_2247 [Demequina mangrovi]
MRAWPTATRGHSRPPVAEPDLDDNPVAHRARLDRLLSPPLKRVAPPARRILCGAVVHIDELSGRVLRCTRDHGHAGTDHDNLGAQVLSDWAETGGAELLTSPIPVTPLGQTIQTIMAHIRSYEGVRQWRLERGLHEDAAAAWERAEALRLLVRTLGR